MGGTAEIALEGMPSEIFAKILSPGTVCPIEVTRQGGGDGVAFLFFSARCHPLQDESTEDLSEDRRSVPQGRR